MSDLLLLACTLHHAGFALVLHRGHLYGLACDPFVGAGTSAVAAMEHGRRFIGGDLGARQEDGAPWVDVAAGVIKARQRQVRLFGAS